MQIPQSHDAHEATRAVLPGECVELDDGTARVMIPAKNNGHQEPDVRLIKDGDIIRAIEVTCGCGKQIRLVCEYA